MSRTFKVIAVIFFAIAVFSGLNIIAAGWAWYVLVSIGLFFFALAEVV